ncbi:MAG: bifunctional folylpolyglutamate synthase/dihydrofolate synthase [Lachnospiraceae bacterium]|nr:bifunctional folylpolyglutamate synthase/dihydrofolate synthase [Lachnospiraceae bacterium]
MMYSYEKVYDEINNARRFGNQPGVEVTAAMLDTLGHPERGIPFIHVAGTNGKGSTCAFLTDCLMALGEKVGTFTSPHLIDFEERIMVNRRMIGREDVTRIGSQLLETEFPIAPTMFDYCLAMALIYFREQQCSVMVIETGLGGRLDSTNAIGTPGAAVITKIGLDHTAILGETLEEIAEEKAGIMKRGCPVISQRQEAEALEILWSHYEKVNGNRQDFWVVTDEQIREIAGINLRLLGVHQWENAACALATVRRLYPNAGELLPVLAKTGWMGRMELIQEDPFFMVDGAHNAHGVAALARSLRQLYPGAKFHFFMAVMADKDYPDMIGELLPLALDFTTYTPESSRALQGEQLAAFIRAWGVEAKTCDNPRNFLGHLPRGERTVAFGSLYFVGEILEIFREEQDR